jgi:hypothetical protein
MVVSERKNVPPVSSPVALMTIDVAPASRRSPSPGVWKTAQMGRSVSPARVQETVRSAPRA